MKPRFVCLAVLVVAILTFSGCGGGWNVPLDANTLHNPVPMNAETIAAARVLYVANCQKCHGVHGDGKIPPDATYFYSTKPTNFTDARRVDSMSEGEIFWKMTNGRKPMPSFKSKLSDEQRWELVNLIRVFAHPERAPK